jgi:glutamate-1-semialdehyde 2,1-aminomutase
MQPFQYNDVPSLKKVASEHRSNLAAIIIEPVRNSPAPGFLEAVRQIADETGAALVFDEITSGFRVATGGIHLTLGVEPDLAVFAKALGNGYPVSAIIGREAVMSTAQDTFISSTAWTERVGPAAALATIRKHRSVNAASQLGRVGQRVMESWASAAEGSGIDIEISGIPPLAHFAFKVAEPLKVRTLFTQLMLDRGYLAKDVFYAMYSHTDAHVDGFNTACAEVFEIIAAAVKSKKVDDTLRGPVAHAGFQRLT